MNTERRRYPRTSRPIDVIWHGASGSASCRLADIGAGGCFVQSLAMPAMGEQTTITVVSGDTRLTLTGVTVYTEPGMGFALEFQALPDTTREQLEALLAPPP